MAASATAGGEAGPPGAEGEELSEATLISSSETCSARRTTRKEPGVLDSPLCRAPSRNLSPDERGALRRVFRDLAKREPRYFGGLVGD